MRITISTLANRLNLSKGTVSRVLNGRNDEFISEATRQRVLEAAKELGYRPNRMAHALATGKTGLIALRIPDFANPFYAKVVRYMQVEVQRHPYQILIDLRQRDSAGHATDGIELPPWPVDGILVHEDITFVRTYLEANPTARPPIVNMGAFFAQTPGVDYVGVDLTTCAVEAMRHLVAQGRTRIAYLVEGPQDLAEDPRYSAYLRVLKEAGLEPEFIFASDHTFAAARQTTRDYVRARGCPDAIFCHNDVRAIGAYRGLRDLGVRIPDDVALVGCDGMEETEYLDPPLSTIVHPIEEMCMLAWQYLERRINEPSSPLQQTVLQPHLVIRGVITPIAGSYRGRTYSTGSRSCLLPIKP